MTYNVAVDALIYVDADSKSEAIEKIKQMFYDGELTIDDLFISIDEEIE